MPTGPWTGADRARERPNAAEMQAERMVTRKRALIISGSGAFAAWPRAPSE